MRNRRIALILIIIFTLFLVVFNFVRKDNKEKKVSKNTVNTSEKKQTNEIDPSVRKDIEEGIKRSQEENKRQRLLEDYSIPAPNSTPPDQNKIYDRPKYGVMVDNVFILYKQKYLNIDQFINVEENINKGIDDFTKVIGLDNEKTKNYYYANKDKLEKQYGVKDIDSYLKLKNLILEVGEVKKTSIDEKSIVKKEENIRFSLKVTGISKNVDIPVTLEIKDNVNDVKIEWNM